jgi:hypothetical protein
MDGDELDMDGWDTAFTKPKLTTFSTTRDTHIEQQHVRRSS